eukprot:g805.t1
MSTLDFAEAKTTLMKSEDGTSVYDHLQELILKIITEKPERSVALFEQLSRVTKKAAFKPKASDDDAGDEGTNAEAMKYTDAIAKHLSPKGDDEIDAEALRDPLSDLEALAYCGANIGTTQAYKLFASMQTLATKLSNEGNLESLRFWGKILGTSADYYVCQGKYSSDSDEETEESANSETGPNSPNAFTYWVSNSLADEWVRLPNVKASEIIAARQIRRFLTGNLDASVKGHPPFPGTERQFLRAQIAQITADCSISPSGFFKQSEDEYLMVSNDEMEPLESLDSLKAADTWCHHHLQIGAQGRCVAFPEEDEDGATKEVEEPEMLRSIEEDSWAISAPVRSKVCLRSQTWEGAHAVAFGNSHAWIYLGYGQRTDSSGLAYSPIPPSAPQSEFDVSEIKEAGDVLVDPTPPEDDEEAGTEGDEE